jgi:hypothetical protein
VKILLYSLLFLAAVSSAVGSLIKSYYFVTDANVCTIRNVPSNVCSIRTVPSNVCTIRTVPSNACTIRTVPSNVFTIRNVPSIAVTK